jgi:hypothetical protein
MRKVARLMNELVDGIAGLAGKHGLGEAWKRLAARFLGG